MKNHRIYMESKRIRIKIHDIYIIRSVPSPLKIYIYIYSETSRLNIDMITNVAFNCTIF